ncbi:unnamed protein product [Candidula unifasciata]|uniref:Uncharacterized protein n=1 Tax=Candidula unifasciata TaxID=100452 RepID=A0A8S3ZCW1_9EUPU|nr:unnamed protein product [Candidula unifasciata]
MITHTFKLTFDSPGLLTSIHASIPLPDTRPLKGQLRFLNYVVPENVTRPPSTCQPVSNIAFVKTHKAGSSTIANILQRYGLTHNLNFALPNTRSHVYAYNYISKPGEILTKEKIIALAPGQEYNILYNHAIYNRTAFRDIMPCNTSYITILRQPFQQFVSAFEYYHIDRAFALRNADILNESNPISTYLANPIKYERGVSYFSYIRNKQAEDLGMGREEWFSSEKEHAYIAQMDRDFSLVMIMEYFDESLLLLKRQLCWEIKDVLYIPKNTNKHKPDRNFTILDYQRHRNISHLDYSLYNHYLAIFQNKLNSLGDDFHQELANFRQLLGHVKQSCLQNTTFYARETRWHPEFEVNQSDCILMLITELGGLDKLLARVGRSISNKVSNVTRQSGPS